MLAAHLHDYHMWDVTVHFPPLVGRTSASTIRDRNQGFRCQVVREHLQNDTLFTERAS
jgi:hypothetical protein